MIQIDFSLENWDLFVEKLGNVFKSILKIVEDLNEEEVSRICDVKDLLQDVRKLFVKNLSFVREIECIYEFLDSNQETVKDIEQDLRRQTPIYEDLLSLLRILSSSIEAAEISYKELNDECGIVKQQCYNAVKVCGTKAKHSKSRKKVTKIVGGTVTAAAIVGGVSGGIGVSFVLGIFTGGIATAVGIPLSLALGATASGVTGTAGAASTYALARHFEKAEEKFQKLYYLFDELSGINKEIEMGICQLRLSLKWIRDPSYKYSEASKQDNGINIIRISFAQLKKAYSDWKKIDNNIHVTENCLSTLTQKIDALRLNN